MKKKELQSSRQTDAGEPVKEKPITVIGSMLTPQMRTLSMLLDYYSIPFQTVDSLDDTDPKDKKPSPVAPASTLELVIQI